VRISLPVTNLQEAKYECIYGRGCDGICCQHGKPPVTPLDKEHIDSVLSRALPLLRPEARTAIEKKGYLSGTRKMGHPMLRTSKDWCVFFNEGCVLHKLGMEDGNSYAYKPAICALFPLEKDPEEGDWFIRQWNYRGEFWDLFCLDPKASPKPAAESMAVEIELAAKLDAVGQNPFTMPPTP